MHLFPHSPRHDAVLRSWLLREHRDVLEEMAVGIVEEHRCGGHPGEDNRLVCRPTIEIEGRNSAARSAPGAASTSARLTENAVCDVILCGPLPALHNPSIAFPAVPIQKNATWRADSMWASRRPTASR